MTTIRSRALALAFTLALAAPVAAQAQVVTDQSAIVPPGGTGTVISPVGLQMPGGSAAPGYRSAVQTFTAGTAGILDHLDFQATWMSPSHDGWYWLSLYDGDYTSGTATWIRSNGAQLSTLPLSPLHSRDDPPAMHFDVRSANYAVVPGQRYSVVFGSVLNDPASAYSLILGYTVGSPTTATYGTNYAGGALHYIFNGAVTPATAYDVGFVSWVDTAVSGVPEPASWALMILGFGAAGGALRRQQGVGERTAAA